MEITVRGERVRLHSDRALIWRGMAFVADVHLGKSATFRAAGLPVPDGELAEDLFRLARLAEEVSRIVVLGDFVHAEVASSVAEVVRQWRATVPIPIALVRGNHDRHEAVLPHGWDIEELGAEWVQGPFVFRHAPGLSDGFVWAGHVHPGVVVGAGSDHIRMPCFHIGADCGVLPAFGRFTGSVSIRLAEGERAYGIVEDGFVEVVGRARRR